jgi:hypothetical protein
MAVAEAPPPKPDAALPSCKGGKDSTAAEPLKGEGGTAGHGDARGVGILPPTHLKALCAMSTCTDSIRVDGGANGGTAVACHLGLAPQGVNNLGEARAIICSLASFPPMSGALAYKLWEARL